MQNYKTFAKTARGIDRLLGIGLVVNLLLLLTAYALPLMTIRRVFLFSETYSFIGTLTILTEQQEWGLALILLVFSFIFPIAKLALALLIWFVLERKTARLSKIVTIVDQMGKWSMIDVVVVALIVVSIKSSFITSVAVHPGIYLFSGAVLLSTILMARIGWLARRDRSDRPSLDTSL
ncbi:MAG: paraquat-inducible protein A [Alphaproteobacteria bacterium]